MKHLFILFLSISCVCFCSAEGEYKEIRFGTESLSIYDACLSANGEVIVCTDNNALKAFSVKTRQLLAGFSNGHKDKVLSVDLSSDSTLLASGGADSVVVLWDFLSHKIIHKISFATGKITTVKFSPDNQFILFGCSNSRAYLWSIKEQRKVYEFTDQEKDITSAAFSSDGRLIAIAGADKIIRIYNTLDFQPEAQLRGHKNWVRSIVFYNNVQNLISCGDDGKVIQWNISNLNNIKHTTAQTGFTWKLSIDIEKESYKNTDLYVSGTISGSIQINYALGKYMAHLGYPVTKVLLIPDKYSRILLAVGTLGSGLMYIDAANMKSSN